MSEIDALLKEDRRFPPTDAWKRQAIINDPGVRSAYLGNFFKGDEFD